MLTRFDANGMAWRAGVVPRAIILSALAPEQANAPAATATDAPAAGGSGGLSVSTIVIICVFSVLIALLLLALLVWRYKTKREVSEAHAA